MKQKVDNRKTISIWKQKKGEKKTKQEEKRQRKTKKNRERRRKIQKHEERLIKTRKNEERCRKAQKGTERHRKAQKGSGRKGGRELWGRVLMRITSGSAAERPRAWSVGVQSACCRGSSNADEGVRPLSGFSSERHCDTNLVARRINMEESVRLGRKTGSARGGGDRYGARGCIQEIGPGSVP